jgi:hypothetical protein
VADALRGSVHPMELKLFPNSSCKLVHRMILCGISLTLRTGHASYVLDVSSPGNSLQPASLYASIVSRNENGKGKSNQNGRIRMKKLILSLLFIATNALAQEPADVSTPLHYRLASDPGLKGKGKEGSCMDYAIALSSKLSANGIHGHLIFFKWHIKDTDVTGHHVFVVYQLPDQTEWIVDNENRHPKLVPNNASPIQLVYILSNTPPSAAVDVKLQDGLNRMSYF